jgi:NAD(P)-dependent dehydrogenase (short-subunit alcohol dehydrogenase family)
MSQQSKTVLITGASRGLGAATAALFVEKGWNVAATMRDPLRPREAPMGDGVVVFALDVTDDASIARAVAAVRDRFGRIDALVNNAGYAVMGPLEGTSGAQLREQFATNVFGLAAVIRQVLPLMRAQRGGTIVNISSTAGRVAFPFEAAYAASKFAVEGLSESLRHELAPFHIKVKVIEPGNIKTGFNRAAQWTEHDAYQPYLAGVRDYAADMEQTLPDAAPVAAAIYRAASDGSNRFRYRSKAAPLLAMHALLPDRLWRALLGASFDRLARSHGGASTP